MLSPQKFVLIHYFSQAGSIEKDVYPIYEINRETIHAKIKEVLDHSTQSDVQIWGKWFDVQGLRDIPVDVYTVEEWFELG